MIQDRELRGEVSSMVGEVFKKYDKATAGLKISPHEMAKEILTMPAAEYTLWYVHYYPNSDKYHLGWDWLDTFKDNGTHKLMVSTTIRFILFNGEAYSREQLDEVKALLLVAL